MQSSKDFSKSHFLNIPLICLQSQIISDNMTSTWYEALKALRSNGASRKTILKTTRSPAIWNPIGLTSLSVAIDITLSANLAKNLLPHISLSLSQDWPHFFSFEICFVFASLSSTRFRHHAPTRALADPPWWGHYFMGMNRTAALSRPSIQSWGGMNIYGPFSHCPIVPRLPAEKYNHAGPR